MSRQLTDADLLIWEAYPSSGPFGFPEGSRILFNCLSDQGRRARYVQLDEDTADAERRVGESSEVELRALFERSSELR